LYRSIVADESVDFRIVTALIEDGFDLYAVVRECPGISDKRVLERASERQALLLTEDSDFGEWIFAHGQKGVSVLYLRYAHHELREIIRAVRMVLNNYEKGAVERFTVITPKKIRMRDIL